VPLGRSEVGGHLCFGPRGWVRLRPTAGKGEDQGRGTATHVPIYAGLYRKEPPFCKFLFQEGQKPPHRALAWGFPIFQQAVLSSAISRVMAGRLLQLWMEGYLYPDSNVRP